jgi:hypothetical protein
VISYDVISLNLSAAGRREVIGLHESVNYLSASIPEGASVYARLGRPEAPRINLARHPILHSTCQGFGIVLFEWEELAGETAEVLLSIDLESAVAIA